MNTRFTTPASGLTRQPRKGDRVAWRDPAGQLYARATVLRVEGNLCWIKPDDGGDSAPFIWWFPRDNAMNKLAEIINEPAYNEAPEAVHAAG